MTDPAHDTAPGLYAAYRDWKGWSRLFTVSDDEAGYFQGEFRDLAVRGADLLEIGFGAGACLAWAEARGARVHGTEIDPALRKAAEARGVAVLPAELSQAARDHPGRFDTIVALDVFEHMTPEEIRKALAAAARLLRPGGHLLMRFPNAQSPFGLAPQMGDPTHRSFLSRSAVELLAAGLPFEVVRYGPAYRHAGRRPLVWLVRQARFALRRAVALALNFAYATRLPYDPVVVLVLRRAAQPDQPTIAPSATFRQAAPSETASVGPDAASGTKTMAPAPVAAASGSAESGKLPTRTGPSA